MLTSVDQHLAVTVVIVLMKTLDIGVPVHQDSLVNIANTTKSLTHAGKRTIFATQIPHFVTRLGPGCTSASAEPASTA
jgi:hypothetical protein